MGETKTTYIMPELNGFGGNDLAAMAMLGNGGFNNGWMNNPFMYLVWIYMMRWMNGNDNGDSSTQRQIQTLLEQFSNSHTSDLVMQAIQGNNNAILDLSTRLGCDINAINSAILGVSASIGQVGNQLGFSSERIINAVNLGDCGVILALKDCCCQTQKSLLSQSYENRIAIGDATRNIKDSINYVGMSVERGFADTNYATLAQTCALQNTIKDSGTANTNAIIAKLDAMQNQALLDKIDALREKNSELAVIINNAQLSAAFNQMLNSYTAPIATAVNSLQSEVASIKCKLPETVNLPYSCATAVPTSMVYNGMCGFNNSLWG